MAVPAILAGCLPSSLPGPTDRSADLACSSDAASQGEERLYVLIQAVRTDTYPGLGASLFTRPATVVRRLSADGRRIEAATDAPGIGLAAFSRNLLARLSPDGARTEFLDGESLAPQGQAPSLGRVLLGCRDGQLVAGATPSEFSFWRVQTPAQPERLYHANLFSEDEGCGLPPVIVLIRDRDPLLGGVCRAQLNRLRFTVVLPAQDRSRWLEFTSPADEFDAPYAVSRLGDTLFVAKPTVQKTWGLRMSDGQVLWEASYGTPPTSSLAKRVFGGNSILVSPDDGTLYLTSAPIPGPAMGVWVLSSRDGSTRARWLPETPVTGTALSRDGRSLFVTTPSDGGSVIVVNTETGVTDVRIRGLDGTPGGSPYRTIVGVLIGPGR